jgi:hypothetical protein
MIAGGMEQVPRHADGFDCGHLGEPASERGYRLPCIKVDKRCGGEKSFVLIVSGFAFRRLLVFGLFLLMQLFAKLAAAVTSHPGPGLVYTFCGITGGIEVIIGNKKVPVERLGEEHQ